MTIIPSFSELYMPKCQIDYISPYFLVCQSNTDLIISYDNLNFDMAANSFIINVNSHWISFFPANWFNSEPIFRKYNKLHGRMAMGLQRNWVATSNHKYANLNKTKEIQQHNTTSSPVSPLTEAQSETQAHTLKLYTSYLHLAKGWNQINTNT